MWATLAIVVGVAGLGFVGALIWMWIDFGEPPWRIFGKSSTE